MAAKTVLVVDDEKDIVKLLGFNLTKEGYAVLTASNGEEGLETARAKKPDLVLLDIMMPGIDGLEVCRLLRSDPATRHIPVIFLTAKSTELDQVVGLELGATDYITKPFSLKVLMARVKSALRRAQAAKEPRSVLRCGELLIDGDKHEFTIKGKPVALTKLEFRILSFLMANPGKVYSRDQLLSGAWEGEAFVVDRTVDVHVKSLRAKMGKFRDRIETVRGTGYRFAEEER